RCATNASDFSRRFKERAGCPLFEFINRQRVARACALLKSSDLSIIEISEAVGYNSLSFFNRYFLRIVGLSPREYRSSGPR
ncbi:MAG TPA: helix-turn-helix transcriptional regulator, partial [Spirochaetales bacterium]|nr:helix-turn-helix transcriptional regulator [Spirochaetales bacterium]